MLLSKYKSTLSKYKSTLSKYKSILSKYRVNFSETLARNLLNTSASREKKFDLKLFWDSHGPPKKKTGVQKKSA